MMLMATPRKWSFLFCVFLSFFIFNTSAQTPCDNWRAIVTVINASNCAASGNFSVTLSGPDVPNLTNIQYGIPINSSGFAVPLNSSSNFTGIPPGAYTVSVVATCGSTTVGKNTAITMPGSYVAPTMDVVSGRESLDCPSALGEINVAISTGRAPYTIHLTNTPASYNGPLSFTSAGGYNIPNTPSGYYTIQVTDACGSGTVPKTVYVRLLSFNDFDLGYSYSLNPLHCDTLVAQYPYIPNGNPWNGYSNNPILKLTMEIRGMPGTLTTPVTFPGTGATFKLPAGLTIKDCYGQTLIYTVTNTCTNQSRTFTMTIPSPYAVPRTSQNCNIAFDLSFEINGPACSPITYRLTDMVHATQYGPYTSNIIPNLPIGSYSYTATTADGFVMSNSFSTSNFSANPYSVSIMPGSPGLQNYIEGFRFSAYPAPRNCSIELFSGPLGYTHSGSMSGSSIYLASVNSTPVLANTYFFGPGHYVWKITDDCGVYYLPVTVGPQHLYQFNVSMLHTKRSCEGLWVWPNATAQTNGHNVPAGFSFLLNNQATYTPINYRMIYHNGDSILINNPGHYTVIPTADYYNLGPYYRNEIPNPYMPSYSFDYVLDPALVDINATQGFLCIGASAGQGQIFAQGAGGLPFASPAHYQYFLADTGNGAGGPYIQNNITGKFINFGAVANALYDVKIVDSCGAFSIQQVRMLDLANIHIINSTKYVVCEDDALQLSAFYLPNATYAWTGPNGFSSSARDPLIPRLTLQNSGTYRVVVTSAECGQPIKDSTTVAINAAPAKPVISLHCSPNLGGYTKIENPLPSLNYAWEFGRTNTPGNYLRSQYNSDITDTALIKLVRGPGAWRGVSINTLTGCRSYSDSIYFAGDPGRRIKAEVQAPRNAICPGDSTILIAGGANIALAYQWFRNGIAILGDTTIACIVNQPGNYKVWISGGYCQADTSDEVTITLIGLPSTSITASRRVACEGDTILLTSPPVSGYAYTWQRDGSSIPGASAAQISAMQSGVYRVTVANGGCSVISDTLSLRFNPAPVVNLTPNTDQQLCSGYVVNFATTANSAYQYTWFRDGIAIANAGLNSYQTNVPGAYTVKVASVACPNVMAGPVNVVQLPGTIDLGPDTVICQPGPFAINLSLEDGFDQIEWSEGQSVRSIAVTAPGLYWVRATNKCGTFTDSLRVRTISEYEPNLPDDVLICNDANRDVFSVPALLQNIKWSNASTTTSIAVTEPGMYWVEGESPCGILRDTMNVRFCVPNITAIKLPADTICEGDCMALSATIENYPQYYRWSMPGGIPDTSNDVAPRLVCYANAGVYPITLRVSNAGGSDSFTTNIVVASKPIPRFADTTFIVSYKKSALLPACAEAAVADWYQDDSLICSGCKTISLEGRVFRSVYHCVVSNGGCADSCIYKMQVIDIPHDVWLPDAFTPNGDGRNDVFRIITDNPNVYGVDLSVYNRWGQKIYISHTREDGWDGSMNGQNMDAGTYFWTLIYKVLGTDETFKRKGDLILIR